MNSAALSKIFPEKCFKKRVGTRATKQSTEILIEPQSMSESPDIGTVVWVGAEGWQWRPTTVISSHALSEKISPGLAAQGAPFSPTDCTVEYFN